MGCDTLSRVHGNTAKIKTVSECKAEMLSLIPTLRSADVLNMVAAEWVVFRRLSSAAEEVELPSIPTVRRGIHPMRMTDR